MAEKKIRAMQVGKQLNIQMRGKEKKSYPYNQVKKLEEIISWTLQEEIEQRRHHDNLLPSEKKNIGKVLMILFFHNSRFHIHKKANFILTPQINQENIAHLSRPWSNAWVE